MYLEWFQLEFLDKHPITVNLISGVVGFSSGVLTVALGVNWFIEREEISNQRIVLYDAVKALYFSVRAVADSVPLESLASTSRDQFLKDRAVAVNRPWDAFGVTDWQRDFLKIRESLGSVDGLKEFTLANKNWLEVEVPRFISAFGIKQTPALTEAYRTAMAILNATELDKAAERPILYAQKLVSALELSQDVLDKLFIDRKYRRFVAAHGDMISGRYSI
jgi:hypothetical protein